MKKNKKFEYKIIDEEEYYFEWKDRDDKGEMLSHVDFLNEFGGDGWELVCAVNKSLFFKREISITKK